MEEKNLDPEIIEIKNPVQAENLEQMKIEPPEEVKEV